MVANSGAIELNLLVFSVYYLVAARFGKPKWADNYLDLIS
jgi:hypothetical protein